MEVKYRADLYTNYLLLEIPDGIDSQIYSFKMMEKNRMKGVLPSKTRMEDGIEYLYLEVGNRRSLVDIYKDKEMDLEEMTRIFQGLLPILEELRNYLLSEKMVLFDPEYIYEEEDGNYCIVILPWQDERPNFRKMAEFFLEKINHKDENGVNAAYHFYRQQSQGPFSLSQFIPVLEKENILKRQKKNKEHIPVVSQPKDWKLDEIEEANKEEDMEEENGASRNWKYIFLILAFLAIGAQFINIIPDRIKLSCMAISVLFLIVFFVLLIPKKEKVKEEKKNTVVEAEEEWEVGETLFFENKEMEESWKLQWKERGRQKQVILEEFPCKVGKIKEEVSVVINDVSVSRVHCQFVKKENKIAIMDLNSTNGTFLNGMPLGNGEMIEIEKNDEILIGKVKVLVV